MPWPANVVRLFQTIHPDPLDSGFQGSYNKLLHSLFPSDTDFAVVPQFLKLAFSESSDYIVAFEIVFKNKPLFILELKERTDVNSISSRRAADNQIRRRLRDLAGQCPIPTLHAVSAMETRLYFYRVDTTDPERENVPHIIPQHPTRVNSTAPAERRGCDVLDAKGEAKLNAVVNAIKEACENIVLA